MAKMADKTDHRRADRQPDPPAGRPARDAGRARPEQAARRSTLQDTPAVRGMIDKVQHLVRVVDEALKPADQERT